MKPRILIALLIAAVATIPAAAFAQAQKTADHSMPKYDVAKEVTLKGTIDDVKEMTMGKDVGVHLIVKTATETIEVRLCPSSYVKDFEVNLTKGQSIQVTGSRVKIEDKEIILARELVQGNNTVTLRDKGGDPVWTWLKKD
jgi:hypothetical protein